jgi:hypothetical protein
LSIFWTNYNFLSEKNRFLRKKRFPSLCRLPRFHGCPNEKICPLFERCFQDGDFFFWITEGIRLTGVSVYFLPQKKKKLRREFLAPFSLSREILTNCYGTGRLFYNFSENLYVLSIESLLADTRHIFFSCFQLAIDCQSLLILIFCFNLYIG